MVIIIIIKNNDDNKDVGNAKPEYYISGYTPHIGSQTS